MSQVDVRAVAKEKQPNRSRFVIHAEELPELIAVDSGDGRMISQFVKNWVAASSDDKTVLVAAPPKVGNFRERVVTAAVVHGMCVLHGYPPPSWVHDYRSQRPIHPVTDRRLTNPTTRAKIVMTASPVCRQHNVWFAESLVSASRTIRPPERPPHARTEVSVVSISEEIQMSKDDFLELFKELDRRLTEAGGGQVTLVVAGGAAICVLLHSGMTADVDVLNEEVGSDVLGCVDAIAKDRQLPLDWLNLDASRYANLDDPGFSSETLYQGNRLEVAAPDLKHLLAMKLLSARDKDLADAAQLAKTLAISDSAELREVLNSVYGNFPGLEESVAWSYGYIDHVLDEIQLQEQLNSRTSSQD